jgi:hypothetical protein
LWKALIGLAEDVEQGREPYAGNIRVVAEVLADHDRAGLTGRNVP